MRNLNYRLLLICCVLTTAFGFIAGCQHKKDPSLHDNNSISKKSESDSSTLESRRVLRGTTVLSGSDKNIESRALFGLYLNSLTSSDCQSHGEAPTPTAITGITMPDDSTLVITANIFANCGQSFLGEIEVLHDHTLNLVYHGYGDYASCMCCFGLTYKIGLFKTENYKFDQLKFVTIDGYAKKKLSISKE